MIMQAKKSVELLLNEFIIKVYHQNDMGVSLMDEIQMLNIEIKCLKEDLHKSDCDYAKMRSATAFEVEMLKVRISVLQKDNEDLVAKLIEAFSYVPTCDIQLRKEVSALLSKYKA